MTIDKINTMKRYTLLYFVTTALWAGSPIEDLNQFRQHGKSGDIANALTYIAPLNSGNKKIDEEADKKLSRIIDGFESGRDITPLEYLEDGNCAVVIIHDISSSSLKIDLHPVFMIRENEKWKLVPPFLDWALYVRFNPSYKDQFVKLEDWYKKRSTVLRNKTVNQKNSASP